MKLVITGTGRSGTGYCAELLRACGVACGHESVFTPDVALGRLIVDWADYEADCSWLAAPGRRWPAIDDAHLVLVTRHPAAVVRSWLELSILDRDDDYTETIRRHTQRTMHGAMADRALRHWVSWNLLAAARADEIVRLEDIDSRHLSGWLRVLDRGHLPIDEVDEALATPRDVNARADAKRRIGPLTRDMFDHQLLTRADPVATMFGYPDWLPT
jgi:hypothetical protein